ncbi:winged helix-turn-helix transcriptional regulator (plasmid) [Rossellomorea sp. AcN35-11]|nr:winged helix-turn-helix transcriptional regulator [Rossellomorea aquimaris]WJV31775.1 winged helix-turn-helix transcriptional regulator [Rossellomorea sp. AcN35-11]
MAKDIAVKKPKNDIEKRKGKFIFLRENTDMTQKQIAEKLGLAPATVNSYEKQYKKGKLNFTPIKVDMNKKVDKKENSGHDQELANKRKAMFVYLVENTSLLQKHMAEIIGVSKAAIGKYNLAYKNNKYRNVEPLKPDGLEKFLTAEQLEDLNSDSSTEVQADIQGEVAATIEETPESAVESDHSVVYGDFNNNQVQEDEEENAKEDPSPFTLEDGRTNEVIKKESMKASVVETTLESAASSDIKTILDMFSIQLDESDLYDFKISIRKKI